MIDRIIISLVVIGMCCVVAFIAVAGYFGLTTDARCKARGWREGSVTWNLQRYCITRTDQSDIVKPLSEIR
jgi:hypothetical protein